MILNLPAGLRFQVGRRTAQLDPIGLDASDWLAITPEAEAVCEEPSPPIARLLATLGMPLAGSIELFGQPLAGMPYVDLQRVRTKLGFVVNRGGLLSNRTVEENVALPISVHAQLRANEEMVRARQLLSELGLTGVATRRPDECDGATRFRACVARALALRPQWIVIEGTGDFGLAVERAWSRLEAYRQETPSALAVCLLAPHPRFEEWFAARGGRVIRYRLLSEAI